MECSSACSPICEPNYGPSYRVRDDVVETSLALGTMSATVGALSGALIDRAIEGRRLVYSASPRWPVFRVAPVLGRSVGGSRESVADSNPQRGQRPSHFAE